MLNHVILMGRLVKEPELRYTNSQTPVLANSLAVDRNYKDGDGNKTTDFIDIVAWRNTAEFINKYFVKGQLVVVEGSWQTRYWKDNNDKNRKADELIVSNIYFAESKKRTSDSNVNESDLEDIPDVQFTNADGDLPF